MNDKIDKLDTPILLMLFNRASTTQKVFEKVREAKPAKLFIAANGPRPDVPSDIEACAAVRNIFNYIDWECEVHTNYREVNIGMHRHWYAALDWFFEHTDNGIILEDDCVPHPSFFPYCSMLLEKYRNDQEIMHINGSNFQFGQKRGDASYYFSRYPHVWGWATWKRAWLKYDNNMSSFPEFKKNNVIDAILTDQKQRKYWMKFFEGLYGGIYNTCDAKWIYAVWANRGICITPNMNMITNIGHGQSAAHTIFKERSMGQEARDIGEIVHPISSAPSTDTIADRFTFDTYFYRTFVQKALYTIAMRLSELTRIRHKS